MIYKIYQIIKPENIQEMVRTDFDLHISERIVLEKCYSTTLYDSYETMQDAENDIVKNKQEFKGKDLCILPVVSIESDGEIL